MSTHIKNIVEEIESRHITVANERDLQDALEVVLEGFHREHSFGPRDRVDFFDPETGLAVEVKIRGQANALIRQLIRYLSKPDVTSGLVVTTSRRLAAEVPGEILGKPVFVAVVSAFM